MKAQVHKTWVFFCSYILYSQYKACKKCTTCVQIFLLCLFIQSSNLLIISYLY